MQDPYPATFQRRHHNISLGAVFFCLHVNNNLSNLFILKDYPFDSIMYVDNTVHGFYSCGPNLKNLPVSTYGMALVCQNQPGKWIFIIFIPTSADTIYVNFYNGYSGDNAGWTGWNSVPLSKKQ